MIVVANKRKKVETIQNDYPGCVIIDVTSNSKDGEYVKFSPFYPHGGIPVPGMSRTAASVEGIWQGLKTFESGEGISLETMSNRTMKNLKRTVRTHGRCLGHQYDGRLLSYIEARNLIYLPAYNWVLENKLGELTRKLRDLSLRKTVVLLDYETNADVNDPTKPLSHASLIKAYVDQMKDENVAAETQQRAQDYSEGMRVSHPKFGEGTIASVDGAKGRISVQFDEVGLKVLATALAKLIVI